MATDERKVPPALRGKTILHTADLLGALGAAAVTTQVDVGAGVGEAALDYVDVVSTADDIDDADDVIDSVFDFLDWF